MEVRLTQFWSLSKTVWRVVSAQARGFDCILRCAAAGACQATAARRRLYFQQACLYTENNLKPFAHNSTPSTQQWCVAERVHMAGWRLFVLAALTAQSCTVVGAGGWTWCCHFYLQQTMCTGHWWVAAVAVLQSMLTPWHPAVAAAEAGAWGCSHHAQTSPSESERHSAAGSRCSPSCKILRAREHRALQQTPVPFVCNTGLTLATVPIFTVYAQPARCPCP